MSCLYQDYFVCLLCNKNNNNKNVTGITYDSFNKLVIKIPIRKIKILFIWIKF